MLATHHFTPAEVDAFAALSGDWNPLHTDPIVARRTPFGVCVVHGVLLLLRALELAPRRPPPSGTWQTISARFLRPVPVGSTVSITYAQKSATELAVTLVDDGRTLALFDVVSSSLCPPTSEGDAVSSGILPRETPENPSLDVESSPWRDLVLHWSAELGSQLFPVLTETQPKAALASLLASTRVIGMKVPGEHSIFLQLDLDFTPMPDAAATYRFRLAEFRRSSQRFGIAIEGMVCRGMLRALLRPKPVNQSSYAEVQQHIPRDRFAGRRVIVLGGSRGLGEITAKALAAGGAEVAITYRLGAQDAAVVVAEIREHGGRAFALQLDVGAADWKSVLDQLPATFDHVCYFATPPISEGDGRSFNQSLFRSFHDVYVTDLVDIALHLAQRTEGRFALFNASSVYVESPPLRHLEYATAKAASEAACRWLALAHPHAKMHVARFPRLLTDQTASLIAAAPQDSLDSVFNELSRWLPE